MLYDETRLKHDESVGSAAGELYITGDWACCFACAAPHQAALPISRRDLGSRLL